MTALPASTFGTALALTSLQEHTQFRCIPAFYYTCQGLVDSRREVMTSANLHKCGSKIISTYPEVMTRLVYRPYSEGIQYLSGRFNFTTAVRINSRNITFLLYGGRLTHSMLEASLIITRKKFISFKLRPHVHHLPLSLTLPRPRMVASNYVCLFCRKQRELALRLNIACLFNVWLIPTK